MKRALSLLVLVAGLATLLPLATQAQTIRYVDVNSPAGAGGTGADWSHAYTNLDAALGASTVGGDSIYVAQGTYVPATTFGMTNGVSVYGGFKTGGEAFANRNWATKVTTLSGDVGRNDTPGDFFNNRGDNRSNVVSFIGVGLKNGYGTLLDGFKIRGGNGGAGIYIGGWGGQGGTFVVSNCWVTDNSAPSGMSGGGVEWTYAAVATGTFVNCVVTTNFIPFSGGGFSFDYNYGSMSLINCTVYGNVITNTANSSRGSGIYVQAKGSSLFFTNTIVYGNLGPAGAKRNMFFRSTPATTKSDYCFYTVDGGSYTAGAHDDRLDDPLLKNPGTFDYHLSSGSPCKTAGVANPGVPKDYDGVTRSLTAPSVGAYEWLTYTITPAAVVNGSISPATPQTVDPGGSKAFTITPDTHYHVLDVQVDGSSVLGSCSFNSGVATYTFNSVAAPHTISVTFALDTYTITPLHGLNGSISPATAQSVNWNDSKQFTITPDTGYHVDDVLVDGGSVLSSCSFVGTVATYTFNSVAATHTINATFAIDANNKHTITLASVPSGLQVTADGSTQPAPYGFDLIEGSRTISVDSPQAAGTGTQYVFSAWSDSGAQSHSINVTADATNTATFTKQYSWASVCKLLDNTPGGGTVDVADGWKNAGATFTATATESAGSKFVRWVTVPGGVELGTSPALGVTMGGPVSVAAVFEPSSLITVQSSPSGRDLVVDGIPGGGVFNWAEGSIHTAAVAVATQSGGSGTQFVWQSWSPSGSQTNVITVGTPDVTYTANFKTQYLWTWTASPAAGGSVTPASGVWYDAGSTPSVQATAAGGYAFKWWSGGLSGTDPNPSVTMNSAKTVVACFGASAVAGVVYVDAAAQGATKDGTSWIKAYTKLQDGLTAATAGKEIWVAAGTYKPGTLTSDRFTMKSGVALYGGFGGYESARSERNWANNVTTLSGDLGGDDTASWGNRSDNVTNVLYASSVTGVVLDGFTVKGGYSTTANGGGLYASASAVTVANCVFTDNCALNGGGAYLNATPATIESCQFVSNGTPTAGLGGGLWAQSSSAGVSGTIRNSVFYNNVCGVYGSGDGGGAWLKDNSYTLVNCTIYGNYAGRRGGGLKLGSQGITPVTFTVKNCIVLNNAIGNGAGPDVYTQADSSTAQTLNMSYCNWAGGGTFANSAATVNTASMQVGTPLFVNAAAGDFHLQSGSPCKDVATSSGAPGTDLDGLTRPQGPGYDIGAYEWDYPERTITLATVPSGLQVIADADTQTAPHGFSLYDGSHTINVDSPQSGGAGVEYRFSNWSDSQAQSHAITVSAPASYTATFTTHDYWQSVCKLVDDTPGGGTVNVADGWKDAGATFTATASAAYGFDFVRWVTVPGGVELGTLPALAVTMSAPVSVAAVFQQRPGTSLITIQSSPAGRDLLVDGTPGGGIFCWDEGSIHTATVAVATQSGGSGTQYVYQSWSPSGSQTNVITVGVPDAAYTANFKTQYLWTWTASPAGSGSVTPASGVWYDAGSTPGVQATAGAGNEFKWWSGDLSGTAANPSVTMNSAKTVVASFGAPAAAGVIYVDAAAQGSPKDGTSWAKAYTNLQDGLTAATAGKEIWVAAGTYKPGTLTSARFTMKSGVALYGGFGACESARSQRSWTGNATILSGDVNGNDTANWGNRSDNVTNVLYANNVSGVVVDGFTVRGGYSTGTTGYGAGMYGNNSTATVANCVFVDNHAGYAGGGLFFAGVNATVYNSSFVSNSTVQEGGGMMAQNGTAVPTGMVWNCVFTGNRCEGDSKSDGGGLYLLNCQYSIGNCTVYNNYTGRRGGGIKVDANGFTVAYVIKNCILWNNRTSYNDPAPADNYGWQLAVQRENSAGLTLDMRNCDWEPGTSQLYNYQGNNTFTAMTEGDPSFVSTAAGDFRLTYGSPCMDTGTSDGAPATDIDGVPRPIGDGIDMGAYECTARKVTVTPTSGAAVTFNGQAITQPTDVVVYPGTYQASYVSPQAAGATTQYVFSAWTLDGSAAGSATPYGVTVGTANRTLDATFTAQYKLALAPGANGSISGGVDGGWYDAGRELSLSGNPGPNYLFSAWGGALSGNVNPQSLIMNAAKTVSATFVFAGPTVIMFQ